MCKVTSTGRVRFGIAEWVGIATLLLMIVGMSTGALVWVIDLKIGALQKDIANAEKALLAHSQDQNIHWGDKLERRDNRRIEEKMAVHDAQKGRRNGP